MLPFGLAELHQCDLGRSLANADAGAIVTVLTLAALEPHILAFALLLRHAVSTY